MAKVAKMSSVPDLPFEEAVKIDVSYLKMDTKNPRLLNADDNWTDEEIIRELYVSEDLSELLQSISANGYINIEPLIVCLDEADGKYVVLEGNRRLAAIRLFRESDLVAKINSTATGAKISLPTIDGKVIKTLSEISVYRVNDRLDAREYIGFKHINGPAKWESYAKAKYAADWYASSQDISLESIAAKIGDRHDTIKRMVMAIYVLEQAREHELFDLSDITARRFNFSHLYTALGRAAYRKHLGIDKSFSKIDPVPNLVPDANLKNLEEILVWIYGSEQLDRDPIISTQNPDIKILAEVLDSPEALHILRAKRPLYEAHRGSVSSNQTLSEALIDARDNLGTASVNLHGYDGQDGSLLSIAENILEAADAIVNKMRKAREEAAGGDRDR